VINGRRPRETLPQLSGEQIKEKRKAYPDARKVIWIDERIDPEETNGHVDDIACFITRDLINPFVLTKRGILSYNFWQLLEMTEKSLLLMFTSMNKAPGDRRLYR